VVEHGADVGIALDGDADRLIAVDHTGNVVDGDHIIAIVADDLRARGELATTPSSSP
jgi:phosphoglucosamine mutase